jgi:hypothetical protein
VNGRVHTQGASWTPWSSSFANWSGCGYSRSTNSVSNSRRPPRGADLTCLESRSKKSLCRGILRGVSAFMLCCADGLQVRGCVVSKSMIATVIVVVVLIVLAIVLLQLLR